MAELQELIDKEFGETVLEIPNPFEKGWLLPLSDASLSEINLNLDLLIDMKKIEEIRRLAKVIHNEGKQNQKTDDVSLAARLCTHDLQGQWALYMNIAGQMHENKKYRKNKGKIEDLITLLSLTRTVSLTMAYLASGGDAKYVSAVPTSQIPFFVPGNKMIWEPELVECESITIVDYIILRQFIRNAKTYCSPEIKNAGSYNIIFVADKGTGIVDKDGIQISKEEIGKIFGNYTTKREGGTGLIVADRLAQLSGGYIELVSVTEGNPAIVYNTKTKSAIEMPAPFQRGARFTLFTPPNL